MMRLSLLGLLGSITIAAPTPVDVGDMPLIEGVSVRLYDIGTSMDRLHPLVPGQTPNLSRVVDTLDLIDSRGDFGPFEDAFVVVADGYLVIDVAGTHAFELTSDDGSQLWIGGTKVIDHDGLHSAESRTREIDLEPGLYPFEVRFFENAGGATLQLRWRTPGAATTTIIPRDHLRARRGEVRVTSPGHKALMLPLERGRPGDGRPLEGVHPSFDHATVRPDEFRPRVGGMDWRSDGRLAICTWDPDGAVYLLDGVQGDDPDAVTVKRIAAGLAEPLGLAVVDDVIYVLQKQELTRLVDHDGDDVIDEYECVCSGWDVTSNFHEFAFGLVHDRGLFYANLATAIDPGGRSTRPQVSDRGSVLEMSTDGRYEIIAHGLRTPNGIGRGAGGEIYVTDNQGDWLPVSKVLPLERGAFYGSRAVHGDAVADLVVTPPVVWLPQGEIGNSPSQPAPLDVAPYTGQMIHGDVTHGGIKRVFVETVGGVRQGTVFRFTQGLDAGVNRLSWGPDGALYVGGIGSTGNWGQEGKHWYALERLTPNGTPTFEMLAVRAMTNGLEIEFTEPLPEGFGSEPGRYLVQQYWYEPTADYGGPKMDETTLTVASANVSSDRRRVFLEIDGLQEGHVAYLRLLGPWRSDAARPIWSTEAWSTLNRIPVDRRGTVVPPPPAPPMNVLTDAERAEGWDLLFDGRTIDRWRGFRRDGVPDAWQVRDGCITLAAGAGGDLITVDEYGDFELQLDWRIGEGGNSGIFYRVSEDQDAVWRTGPEMQILDSPNHPDGRNPATSAGADYAMHAPPFDATAPVGMFNHVRIRAVGPHVTYWLNGEMLVDFEIGSEDWERRLAASKFATFPRFGRNARGHIALQDHGDPVAFRNLKIRRLD